MDEVEVSSLWTVPDGFRSGQDPALILAHGAGNDMNHPFLGHVAEGLAGAGALVVRFNFPYKEQGRKAPDRAPVLERTWRAVIDVVRADAELQPGALFLAGKSMGGRMASHVVATGASCSGLVFLGYPLHPAGKPDKLRVEHLDRIAVPMLFIQGTRDRLCQLDLLRPVLDQVKTPVDLHIIEGADHSFKVPKRLGRTEQSVWNEIVDVSARWMEGVAQTG